MAPTFAGARVITMKIVSERIIAGRHVSAAQKTIAYSLPVAKMRRRHTVVCATPLDTVSEHNLRTKIFLYVSEISGYVRELGSTTRTRHPFAMSC